MKKKLLNIYLIILFLFTVAPVHLFLPNFEDDRWQNPFLLNFPPDKVAHLLFHFILALLIIWNFQLKKKYYFLGIAYGVILEAIQYPISFRSFEIIDLLANILGFSSSYLLARLKKLVELNQ